jgi:hypothetical protein
MQAYKHIFTSPSSVVKEPKATRSGNARIHGMTRVTPASIAYIATQVSFLISFRLLFSLLIQVRFALSSSPVFSRTDTSTDSETFYNSMLDLFYDVHEKDEVDALLAWWNRYEHVPLQSDYLTKSISVKYSLAIHCPAQLPTTTAH